MLSHKVGHLLHDGLLCFACSVDLGFQLLSHSLHSILRKLLGLQAVALLLRQTQHYYHPCRICHSAHITVSTGSSPPPPPPTLPTLQKLWASTADLRGQYPAEEAVRNHWGPQRAVPCRRSCEEPLRTSEGSALQKKLWGTTEYLRGQPTVLIMGNHKGPAQDVLVIPVAFPQDTTPHLTCHSIPLYLQLFADSQKLLLVLLLLLNARLEFFSLWFHQGQRFLQLHHLLVQVFQQGGLNDLQSTAGENQCWVYVSNSNNNSSGIFRAPFLKWALGTYISYSSYPPLPKKPTNTHTKLHIKTQNLHSNISPLPNTDTHPYMCVYTHIYICLHTHTHTHTNTHNLLEAGWRQLEMLPIHTNAKHWAVSKSANCPTESEHGAFGFTCTLNDSHYCHHHLQPFRQPLLSCSLPTVRQSSSDKLLWNEILLIMTQMRYQWSWNVIYWHFLCDWVASLKIKYIQDLQNCFFPTWTHFQLFKKWQ